MFFRLLVLFFTVATIVFLAWSLVGCYKNESYLTDNYLISFQLSNLNLSALFENTSPTSKRELEDTRIAMHILEVEPTKTLEARDDVSSLLAQITAVTSILGPSATQIPDGLSNVNTASLLSEAQALASTATLPDSIATLLSEIQGDFSSALDDIIASATPSDLGLSDMYSVGFYGYCKGDLTGNVTDYSSELGELGKQFRNDNVNYTYCSSPKFGYKFDPLALIKNEMLDQIQDYSDDLSSLPAGLSDLFVSELLTVASSLTYDNLGLPGSLKQDLNMLNSATIAGFSLLFAGACLSFVSFVFQVTGLTCSPNNWCLSCCNFILMVFVALVVMIGSGLTTGVFLYVRKTVNGELDEFGVKSYLSQQFYAFAWCAAVCALLFVVLSIIGYCCGCFHPRRRYKELEPDMRYDHKA